MFTLKINGENVKELDIDPIMVEAIRVGSHRIPIQTNEVDVDIKLEFRSHMDGELLEKLKRDGMDAYLAEQEELVSDEVRDIVAEQNKRDNPEPQSIAPLEEEEETEDDSDSTDSTDSGDHSDSGTGGSDLTGNTAPVEQNPFA